MFYKIKIYFLIHIIGADVLLAASQISSGSLLFVNHPVHGGGISKSKLNLK
jgi:hypothetical protein